MAATSASIVVKLATTAIHANGCDRCRSAVARVSAVMSASARPAVFGVSNWNRVTDSQMSGNAMIVATRPWNAALVPRFAAPARSETISQPSA